jgi:pyridoxal phosphate enzyme (YggS family)
VSDNTLSNPDQLKQRFNDVQQRIQQATSDCQRNADSVELLAVSKTRSSEEVRALASLGQRMFGENYLQEAISKIDQLADLNLSWHFIGRIQSNKTRQIAEHFDWVHSVASLKHATRLNQQRPEQMPPLNICLQVNTSGEMSKDGHSPEELAQLLPAYQALEKIKVRGLMTIPAPVAETEDPSQSLKLLHSLREQLKSADNPLDTLSMGMSNDLEEAICEGSTIVRIGTALFGPRNYREPRPDTG